MAPGRRDVCRGRGAVGTCATAQVAFCKATAGHRQLVLLLGGSGDSPWLREERCRRSAEACELSMGLRQALLAGLRQPPASPLERQELERLWVLFLSTLELFLQDLYRAQHLCQLFSMQGGGVAPLRTGLGCWGLPSRRGGGPSWPPTTQCLEEEIEQVMVGAAPILQKEWDHYKSPNIDKVPVTPQGSVPLPPSPPTLTYGPLGTQDVPELPQDPLQKL